MTFTLDKVVPWGRSFDEYVAMFALSGADLEKRILGCGDGPAGFAAGLARRGGRVVSVDPMYRFSAEAIRARIDATREQVLAQTRANAHEFVWDRIKTAGELGAVRMEAMNTFLADYAVGTRDGRYVCAALPCLPFSDGTFDIALCSHFLFLYSEQFSFDFHLESIGELCRVASEARIFPLLELGARQSRHLDGVLAALESQGFGYSVEPVPYEFQKGGNRMLCVKRRSDNG